MPFGGLYAAGKPLPAKRHPLDRWMPTDFAGIEEVLRCSSRVSSNALSRRVEGLAEPRGDIG